jgi:hypothetical protein
MVKHNLSFLAFILCRERKSVKSGNETKLIWKRSEWKYVPQCKKIMIENRCLDVITQSFEATACRIRV